MMGYFASSDPSCPIFAVELVGSYPLVSIDTSNDNLKIRTDVSGTILVQLKASTQYGFTPLIWELKVQIIESSVDLGDLINLPPFFDVPPSNEKFEV